MKLRGIYALALTAALVAGAQAGITSERILTGLASPLFVTHAPGDFDRIFIIEQPGRVRIMKNGALLATPFLDITTIVNDSESEQGLLGLAFDPNYATSGLFYVSYTNNAGTLVVRQYLVSADPDIADGGAFQNVIRITQPQPNHNGGWIGFGPDGLLYVAVGDGGNSNDSGPGHSAGGNAQDIDANLLGKMLRLDPRGDDFPADSNANYTIPPSNPFVGIAGDDEIWAYGLRNPWRNSFDRVTGELYIGDVGQGQREEVDVQPADSDGGENYGWRCIEGFRCTGLSGCDCNDINLTAPILDYTHGGGRCSITGGYVYRGCAIPSMVGSYFYADFCTAQIWTTEYDGVSATTPVERTAQLVPDVGSISFVSSFGEDAYGELYICDLFGGEVFKIVPDGAEVVEDCDNNNEADACELLADPSLDLNGNGILDVCDCPGDINGDGVTDLGDLSGLLGAFGASTGDPNFLAGADLDGSGTIDLGDLSGLLSAFGCDMTP